MSVNKPTSDDRLLTRALDAETAMEAFLDQYAGEGRCIDCGDEVWTIEPKALLLYLNDNLSIHRCHTHIEPKPAPEPPPVSSPGSRQEYPACQACGHRAAAHDRAGCCVTKCPCTKGFVPSQGPPSPESEVGRIFQQAQLGIRSWNPRASRTGIRKRSVANHQPLYPKILHASTEPIYCSGCGTRLQGTVTHGRLAHHDLANNLHFPETCRRWLKMRGPIENP